MACLWTCSEVYKHAINMACIWTSFSFLLLCNIFPAFLPYLSVSHSQCGRKCCMGEDSRSGKFKLKVVFKAAGKTNYVFQDIEITP